MHLFGWAANICFIWISNMAHLFSLIMHSDLFANLLPSKIVGDNFFFSEKSLDISLESSADNLWNVKLFFFLWKVVGIFQNSICCRVICYRLCLRPHWLSWMWVLLLIRRLQIQHSFVVRGDWSWNIFNGHISLLLIQEGQLSVSSERMYTILINGLED